MGTRLFDAPTDYELDGKSASALLTPLALVQLLDPSQRPNRVVAMVTPGAQSTTWPVFEKEICSILGFKPESVSIPDGRNSDEIREISENIFGLIIVLIGVFHIGVFISFVFSRLMRR